jgi:integrase/recombinase XerD
MIKDINTYLAFRRAAGFELHNDEYLLHSYARFADASNETFIRTSTAIKWAGQSVSVAQRDVRLKTLCRFARYICLEDKRHELPPAGHFAYHKTRRLPYIYSDEELTSLIKTALLLGPLDSLRPYTYGNLIALLSATGLRISEALRLQFSDITPDGLLIRNTKFRKSRLVPLHDSVVLGLERYLIRRQSLLSVSKEVFITDEGQKLSYPAVHYTFKKLLKSAKVLSPPGVAQPRLHDFRHRFAVNSLLHSSPGQKTVSQHMLALATYLGHINVYSTFWYLEAAPELLRNIVFESEKLFLEGDQL